MMRFLRGLATYFRNWAANKVRVPLRAEESVTRFVFRTEHLFKDGRAKPKAFMPETHPATGEFELSVCRLEGCPEQRTWHVGKTCRRDVALKARADFPADVAFQNQLHGFRAPEPDYAEHAILLGWPPADGDKSHRMSIAQALADAARVHAPPT